MNEPPKTGTRRRWVERNESLSLKKRVGSCGVEGIADGLTIPTSLSFFGGPFNVGVVDTNDSRCLLE